MLICILQSRASSNFFFGQFLLHPWFFSPLHILLWTLPFLQDQILSLLRWPAQWTVCIWGITSSSSRGSGPEQWAYVVIFLADTVDNGHGGRFFHVENFEHFGGTLSLKTVPFTMYLRSHEPWVTLMKPKNVKEKWCKAEVYNILLIYYMPCWAFVFMDPDPDEIMTWGQIVSPRWPHS